MQFLSMLLDGHLVDLCLVLTPEGWSMKNPMSMSVAGTPRLGICRQDRASCKIWRKTPLCVPICAMSFPKFDAGLDPSIPIHFVDSFCRKWFVYLRQKKTKMGVGVSTSNFGHFVGYLNPCFPQAEPESYCYSRVDNPRVGCWCPIMSHTVMTGWWFGTCFFPTYWE